MQPIGGKGRYGLQISCIDRDVQPMKDLFVETVVVLSVLAAFSSAFARVDNSDMNVANAELQQTWATNSAVATASVAEPGIPFPEPRMARG